MPFLTESAPTDPPDLIDTALISSLTSHRSDLILLLKGANMLDDVATCRRVFHVIPRYVLTTS
jgi:hypothetical protein